MIIHSFKKKKKGALALGSFALKLNMRNAYVRVELVFQWCADYDSMMNE